MYTIKQLTDLASVSVRTLHYYDEIGLLKPTRIGANSYRYYDDAALLRLQQILFYREIGLELMQIKDVLDDPNFDVMTALRSHRTVLQEKAKRLNNLVATIDSTLMHLVGERDMSKKQLFEAFSEEKQKDYERTARLQYGPDMVNASIKLWNSYSHEKRQQVLAEGRQIFLDLAKAMQAKLTAESAEVRSILQRWQDHQLYFFEPTLEVLRGLGELYNTSPDFMANFKKIHPDLPAYLQETITDYVDALETEEIERLLAEDEDAAHTLRSHG
jgi:MerR family transcriptional regulator, thiopeptide resistance regulator